MKEIFGWILLGIASICGIVVFIKSFRAQNPVDFYARRSIFEREFEHQSKLSQDPVFVAAVWLGIAASLIGMWLIGMFGGGKVP